MIALVLKDLRASARYLLGFSALSAAMSMSAARVEEALFWLGIGFTVGLWVVPAIVDWQVDADRLTCSLPVERATVVAAKHVWMLGALAIGSLCWAGAGSLWRAVDPRFGQAAVSPVWQSMDGVLTFWIIAAVLSALFLPAYVKFGIGKGSAVFAILALALVAAVAAATRFGAIPGSAAGGVAGAGNLLPAQAVIEIVSRLVSRFGLAGAVALLAGFAAATNWLALRMAVRFYGQREF